MIKSLPEQRSSYNNGDIVMCKTIPFNVVITNCILEDTKYKHVSMRRFQYVWFPRSYISVIEGSLVELFMKNYVKGKKARAGFIIA